MTRFLKEPLLHFMLLGAALFGLFALAGGKENDEPAKIIVSTAQIANLRDTFARTWQRPPTVQELQGLIEDHIRSEIYAREARALELDRDDIVIRRRLRQKMEFFAEDMLASAPRDADLETYLATHPEQFRSEDRMTFRHVFLSATRGTALNKEAQEIGAKLATGKVEGDIGLGDAFLLGASFRAMSRSEAARTFGENFVEKLFAATPRRWQGPIPSGYGLHFVYVDESTPGTVPVLDAIRPAVEREWANTRRIEKLEEFYRTLQRRYEITVETPPEVSAKREMAGAIK